MHLIVFLIALLIGGIVGAICWPYTINTWLVYCHRLPIILWWHGALMGFVPGLGQLSIPLSVLTWIIMMFIA